MWMNNLWGLITGHDKVLLEQEVRRLRTEILWQDDEISWLKTELKEAKSELAKNCFSNNGNLRDGKGN